MSKLAICQVADTGPLESLVTMLRSSGYECLIPNKQLRAKLREIGCDTVLDIDGLVRGMGYSQPMPLPSASVQQMSEVDLYVDIKGYRNGPLVWEHWPNLKDKTLWYRINGGKPENHPVAGDEINPPCPILTPNLWYRDKGPWSKKAYSFWPPFLRFDDYYVKNGRVSGGYTDPVCLTHNLAGWGYRLLIEPIRELGVRCYGEGSPDGLIQHSQVAEHLREALCMVHLKSSDAPGYSLYETMAAACPLVVTRRLIWRNRMQDLLEPGVTCLVFDQETEENLSPEDVTECTREVSEALVQLSDPVENERIGKAGHQRLKDVMWNEDKDTKSLAKFMSGMYGA